MDVAKEGWTGTDTRNPRSGLCLKHDGKLVLLVADGRQTISEGLFLREEASLFKEMGCREALNLDGGGSSLLLVNGFIVNHPSDVVGPRAVTNVLMVVDRSRRKGQTE